MGRQRERHRVHLLTKFCLESGFSNVFQADFEGDNAKSFLNVLDMGIFKDAKIKVCFECDIQPESRF